MSDDGGLFPRITPADGKLWRWKYRHEGLEKLMSFGKYPDVTLTVAREKHGEARKLLAAGSDPMVRRKTEKMAERAASENAFASVAAQWIEDWQDVKSPRHVDSTGDG